jgi:hypothetical protein
MAIILPDLQPSLSRKASNHALSNFSLAPFLFILRSICPPEHAHVLISILLSIPNKRLTNLYRIPSGSRIFQSRVFIRVPTFPRSHIPPSPYPTSSLSLSSSQTGRSPIPLASQRPSVQIKNLRTRILQV